MGSYQASVRGTMSGSTKPATERTARVASLLACGVLLCGCAASAPQARLGADPSAAAPQIHSFAERFNRVDHIVALVMINGHGPFRFMLDTGANRTVLAEYVVQRLGLAFDGDNQVLLQGGIVNITVPTAHIDTLSCEALL